MLNMLQLVFVIVQYCTERADEPCAGDRQIDDDVQR